MERVPRGPGKPGPKPPEKKKTYQNCAVGCGAVTLVGIILVVAMRALFPTPQADRNIWIYNSASVPVNVRLTYEGNIVDAVRSMGYDGADFNIEPGKAVRYHPPYMGKFTLSMKQTGDLPATECSVALHDRREFTALVDLAGKGKFALEPRIYMPYAATEEDRARFADEHKDILAGGPKVLEGKQLYVLSHSVHYGIDEPFAEGERTKESGGEVRWKLWSAGEFARQLLRSRGKAE